MNIKDSKILNLLIKNELERYGVRLPREKKKKHKEEDENPIGPFGQLLDKQEWLSQPFLPSFLYMCTSYLSKHLTTDGLFRKSGSKARQKDLKRQICHGMKTFPPETDPHDVASLLKCWLRELPEPLISEYVGEVMVRCLLSETSSLKPRAATCTILSLACLLLPPRHILILRHLLNFLFLVSTYSKTNLMTVHNLATVLAPNFFPHNDTSSTVVSSPYFHLHITLLGELICHWDQIGQIPTCLANHLDVHSVDQAGVGHQVGALQALRDTFLTCFNKVSSPEGPLEGSCILKPRTNIKRRGSLPLNVGIPAKREEDVHPIVHTFPLSFQYSWPSIQNSLQCQVPKENPSQTFSSSLSSSRSPGVGLAKRKPLRRGRPNSIHSGLPVYALRSKNCKLKENETSCSAQDSNSRRRSNVAILFVPEEWEVQM